MKEKKWKCYESGETSVSFSLAEALANPGILLTLYFTLPYFSVYSHHRLLI